jgi:hypothetical protein
VDAAGLAAMLDQYESLCKGAVYCAIPDRLFRGEFAALLRQRGYAFWVRVQNNPPACGDEFVIKFHALLCHHGSPRYSQLL